MCASSRSAWVSCNILSSLLPPCQATRCAGTHCAGTHCAGTYLRGDTLRGGLADTIWPRSSPAQVEGMLQGVTRKVSGAGDGAEAPAPGLAGPSLDLDTSFAYDWFSGGPDAGSALPFSMSPGTDPTV